MCNDPKTRRNLGYATLVSSNLTPRIIIALDPDNDEQYVWTPKAFF